MSSSASSDLLLDQTPLFLYSLEFKPSDCWASLDISAWETQTCGNGYFSGPRGEQWKKNKFKNSSFISRERESHIEANPNNYSFALKSKDVYLISLEIRHYF